MLQHAQQSRIRKRQRRPILPKLQVIDDTAGHTLAAASDTDQEVKTAAKDSKTKTDVAGVVGEALAKRAKEKGIKAVVFDRGGFKYHGRVKALAEAVRKGGISF